MIKAVAKDLLHYIPSQAVPAVFGLFLIPILTSLFKPDDYGHYVIVIITINILSIIGTDWLKTSIVRFYAEYENKSQLKMFNGTVIRLMGCSIFTIALTVCLVLFLFRKYLDQSLYYYLNIGLLIFCLGSSFSVMLEILRVMRKPQIYSLMVIWRQCICIVIGIGIVTLYKSDIASLLWGILIGVAVAFPIMFKLSFKKFSYKEYSHNFSSDIIKYGLPLVASNLASWLIALSDRYIIQFFRGSYEVGLYAISHSIADNSIHIIEALILLSSAPIAYKLWETKGVGETQIFMKDLTKYYLIITMPAVVGISLLSEPCIRLLTNQNFYEGHKIIPMIAVASFLYGLQRNFQMGLLFHKKTLLVMYIISFCGFMSVVLNIAVVPKYGFIAAGYTSMLSSAMFLSLMILISRRYFTFSFPFKSLMNVIISVIVMSMPVLFIVRLNLSSVFVTIILSIIIGATVYFFSLIVLHEIKADFFKNIFLLHKRDNIE